MKTFYCPSEAFNSLVFQDSALLFRDVPASFWWTHDGMCLLRAHWGPLQHVCILFQILSLLLCPCTVFFIFLSAILFPWEGGIQL